MERWLNPIACTNWLLEQAVRPWLEPVPWKHWLLERTVDRWLAAIPWTGWLLGSAVDHWLAAIPWTGWLLGSAVDRWLDPVPWVDWLLGWAEACWLAAIISICWLSTCELRSLIMFREAKLIKEKYDVRTVILQFYKKQHLPAALLSIMSLIIRCSWRFSSISSIVWRGLQQEADWQ